MSETIKQREILFCELHPDAAQAETAAKMLTGLEGIIHVSASSPTRLIIHYELLYHTLEDIESLLAEVGFHLENNLLLRLKRALYQYTEENERINHGYCKEQSLCTRDIYIKRYQHLPHGCRDRRPTHWRGYL